ncbi:PemK family transcriptional regulator [Drancourtella sp. An177]|nr:PemK family transcriptional regulator [Drancourtella sp. An177]
MQVHRGDIFYADLSPVIGSEQGGIRPVLIIQNEMGNKHSPTVICAAITSRMNKAKLPTHVEIDARRYGVVKNSVVLLEQIRTIDKQRLKENVCHLDKEIMRKVDEALRVSFALST